MSALVVLAICLGVAVLAVAVVAVWMSVMTGRPSPSTVTVYQSAAPAPTHTQTVTQAASVPPTPSATRSATPSVAVPSTVDSTPHVNELVSTSPQQIKLYTAPSGVTYVALRVRSCIVGLPGVPYAWLGQDPWTITRADGTVAAPSGGSFPGLGPTYPRSEADGHYQPGDCVDAWMTFPATSSAVTAVHYRDTRDSSDVAWAVG